MSKVVLLVPFSSEEPSRLRIWKYVNSWLEQTLNYPIYIGDYMPKIPSEYCASLPRNQAAQMAGDWDVAVIHDADTVLNPKQIQEGVAVAEETGAVTYPYTERWELTFKGTSMLLNDEQSDWQRHMRQYTYSKPLGGCIIVRRDLWDLVRGFDTGFVGWGHEDGAFAIACEVLSGKKLKRIPGKSLHLEHVFAPTKKSLGPLYLANQTRVKKYLKAMDTADGISIVRNLRDQSIVTDAEQGIIWPKHQPNTKRMDQATALMLLKDVTKVLDKYKCTHWLSDGTLLGAIRENNFIAHDDDIDLGVWAEDFNTKVIHELINIYNCGVFRLQGKPDDGMVITLGRAGIHLDMFFYYPVKTNNGSSKRSNIYCSYYKLYKPYETSNRAKRYNFEYPMYEPLAKYKFLGHEFWVPNNAKRYLKTEYGPEWQKPNRNWNPDKDYPNRKYVGIIEDMAALELTVEHYLKDGVNNNGLPDS